VQSYDALTNTAVVYTNYHGLIKCRVGGGYSDTDWPESGAEQDNTQFGEKRPYRARERVVVLLLNDCRLVDGVIICSLATVQHKLNIETSVTGEHDNTYDIEGKRVLHIRDDYWLRTIKQVTQIAVEDMMMRSESARVDVDAYTDIKLRAKEENVTIDAEKKDVVTHAGQDVLTTSDRDTTLTVKRNVTVDATGTADYKSGKDVTIEAGTDPKSGTGNVVIKEGSTLPTYTIQLGNSSAMTVAIAEGIFTAMAAMLTAFELMFSAHMHPCTAPGAPSGPPLPAPPASLVQQAWDGAKEVVKSTLVKAER
jgi:hypothetical protein